jgi:hypothetical protein
LCGTCDRDPATAEVDKKATRQTRWHRQTKARTAGSARNAKETQPVTTLALDRSREQRIAALLRANQIRIERSKLKKSMTLDTAISHVAAPPAFTQTMLVADLLRAVPKFGRARVERLMRRLQIADQKTLEEMSDRQRSDLADALRDILEGARDSNPAGQRSS